MTKLPEPDWITLSESASRVERASGPDQDEVETALVTAIDDSNIRMRGRCRRYFGDDRRHDLPRLIGDRPHVIWQINHLAIPSGKLDPKMYLVSDVYVCKQDLEKWIDGATPYSQRAAHELVEISPPEPPAPDQGSPSKQSKQTRRKKPAEQMHDRWVYLAKELKEGDPSLGTSKIARKIRSAEAKFKDLNTKGQTRDVATIRRVLYERKSEWVIPQES